MDSQQKKRSDPDVCETKELFNSFLAITMIPMMSLPRYGMLMRLMLSREGKYNTIHFYGC
jgi:hypothetical protein